MDYIYLTNIFDWLADKVFAKAGDMLAAVLEMICLFVDKLIYQLAAALYNIFMAVATQNESVRTLFGPIDAIAGRLIVLVGVFMFFRFLFSLVTYLVSPDKLTDSNAGGVKIVINIVVSLALLAGFQTGFDLLYKAQNAILDDQIINKIILGSGGSMKGASDKKGNMGRGFALSVWSSFFSTVPSEDNPDTPTKMCSIGVAGEEDSSGDKANNCQALITELAYSLYGVGSVGDIYEKVDGKDGPLLDYHPVISGFAGIYLCVMLIMFTIDVGVRNFKLIFFQIIAPIPIIAYMDPGGKAKGMLSRWGKAVGMTFLDLFIRIASVLLAMALISLIAKMFSDVGDGVKANVFPSIGGFSEAIAKLLLIIAAFQFAKALPKIINDLFGLKIGENSSISKGLFGTAGALGLGTVLGTAGLVGGLARGEGIGGAMKGLGRGVARGAWMGSKHRNWKDMKGGMGNAFNKFQQYEAQKAKDKAEGIGFKEKWKNRAGSFAEGVTGKNQIRKIQADSANKEIEQLLSLVDKQSSDYYNQSFNNDNPIGKLMNEIKDKHGQLKYKNKDEFIGKSKDVKAAEAAFEELRLTNKYDEKKYGTFQEAYNSLHDAVGTAKENAEKDYDTINSQVYKSSISSSKGEIYETASKINNNVREIEQDVARANGGKFNYDPKEYKSVKDAKKPIEKYSKNIDEKSISYKANDKKK